MWVSVKGDDDESIATNYHNWLYRHFLKRQIFATVKLNPLCKPKISFRFLVILLFAPYVEDFGG